MERFYCEVNPYALSNMGPRATLLSDHPIDLLRSTSVRASMVRLPVARIAERHGGGRCMLGTAGELVATVSVDEAVTAA